MPHAGLDVSDDAIRCIEYHQTWNGLIISKFATQELSPGLIDGGDIKDEKAFVSILRTFAHTNALGYVKVSLPEEKAYLFQTEVPSANFSSIAQNIEFKLDQNVPLSAADALFQFDLMPKAVSGEVLRTSVSVVPRTYVEKYISLLRQEPGTRLIVHIMKKKTGLYIVSEGVVCFTSTIGWGSDELSASEKATSPDMLTTEINRVYSYWLTRSDIHVGISEIVVVGSRAEACEHLLHTHGGEALSHSVLPDVWRNAFNINTYVPPITHSESFAYAIAAGLAL